MTLHGILNIGFWACFIPTIFMDNQWHLLRRTPAQIFQYYRENGRPKRHPLYRTLTLGSLVFAGLSSGS